MLLEYLVKALVKRAAQGRLDLFAELLGVRGRFMRIKRVLVLPDLDNGEMIDSIDLHKDLDAHRALFLARVLGILPEHLGRGGRIVRHSIHVDHNVDPIVVFGWLLRSGLTRETRRSQNQNHPDSEQQSPGEIQFQ